MDKLKGKLKSDGHLSLTKKSFSAQSFSKIQILAGCTHLLHNYDYYLVFVV